MLAVGSIALSVSCSSISTFDQKAYENVTALKVDARNVMGLASQSYSSQREKVADLNTSLEKAYEYDLGRPVNRITVAQWDLLLKPEGDLLGGFLKEWKQEGKLLPGYVRSKQRQVGRGFDAISGLESGKLKPTDIQ